MFGMRLLWRDWRGGELGVLFAALLIAVAIVTGISLFTDRLQQGITAQSSHFLAADRVLRTSDPVDPSWLYKADELGLLQAQTMTFRSMVYVGEDLDGKMQFSAVKAVSDSYPLKGQLDVSDTPFGTVVKTPLSPPRGEVWLDSRLFPLLQVELGDSVFVGDAEFTVTKVVMNEPDRGSVFSGFAPRLLMNIDDIPATNVVQPGSRVRYRYLFSGDNQQLLQYGEWLQSRLDVSHRWLDLRDSQPRISNSMKRAEQFLLLAGALGVGLAGVAIALAARRYSERHYDYVAIMKSLGATSSRIMTIYTTNLLVLAMIAVVIGSMVGWLIQTVFFSVLMDYMSINMEHSATFRPYIIGSVTALVCLMAFALPPLLNLQGISPLRVLRRDLQGAMVSSVVSYAMGVGGIGLLMLWYSGNIQLTLAILAGIAATFIIVGAAAWYLLRGSTHMGMQAGSTWRLALASMRRRGYQNAVQAVIFSLSIMLLLVLFMVRSSLIEEWRIQLPEGTPNHFLMNVSAEEISAVEQLLADNGVSSEPIFPMARARLVNIGGMSREQWIKQEVLPNMPIESTSRPENIAREVNLTWAYEMPSDNRLVEGTWWPPGSTKPEVSLEVEFAERLRLNVGDKLVFQIGSEPLEVEVSSIRSLNWDSMKPNFFLIFPPKVLKDYPATYITSFYLPPDKKRFLNQFLLNFPTITVIEMDAVIHQIRTIVDQVSGAVELVLGLIIVSGVLVLIASVQSSLDSRFQESAILRTLGAKRGLVLGSLAIEFSALGLLAGVLAAFSAELAVFGLQEYLLNMTYTMHPVLWFIGPIVGMVLIGSAGYVTCRKVVNTPPVKVLREL